ncbi:MAG: peptide chain release factor 2, partial [Anaeroplasmataceae bacterium]|nr:peptide chain release factor 2 [Anaeroplasmataceae bacterium]
FKTEYEQKLQELKMALGIDAKRPILKDLEKEIAAPDFWNDQNKAQGIINQMNLIKETIVSFDDMLLKFQDIEELMDMALEDMEAMELLESMIEEFKKAMNHMEEQALLSGKYDYTDCILELHPGAGGTESMDWADMLYRMYMRFCNKKGYKMTVLDYLPGDEAGIKSITLSIQGPFAYGLFKAERGVHRLVRISPFDSNARRHTSFVSCDVSPQIPEAEEISVKDEDIKIDVYHSSGAGGQSVNTTDSAVRITHKPTGIVVTCQNERSQIKNREVAMRVLKSKLLELELKKQEEEMKSLKGSQMEINFGSQIRSYVFCPYTLVKDHRTNFEMGNITAVMDGDIEGFMLAYLRMMVGKENG